MEDFRTVILNDSIMEGFVRQGVEEGLITLDEQLNWELRKDYIQDSLAAIVLFDKILIADFSKSLRSPRLEDDGFIQFLSFDGLPKELYSLGETSSIDEVKNAFEMIVQQNRLIKPLILNRIVNDLEDGSIWKQIAKALNRTVYDICSDLFDYISYFYFGENYISGDNIFLTEPFKQIREGLDRDLRNEIPGMIGYASMFLGSSIVAAHQINVLQETVSQQNASIASIKYTGLNRDFKNPVHLDANSSIKGFHLVRSVLNEEMTYFPCIDSIEHALILRKDPNIQSFREQFRLFHQYLSLGDIDAVERIRKDVLSANKSRSRLGKLDGFLRFVSYMSVPLMVIEGVLNNTYASSFMTVFSAAASYFAEDIKSKSKWILFGQ